MNREIKIRKYEPSDIPAMVRIWNEVVEEGVAFPQEDGLTEESGSLLCRRTAVSLKTVPQKRCWDFIFCIPIISADVDTFPMQVMQWHPLPADCTLAKNW